MDISENVMNHIEDAKDYLELVDKLVTPQTASLDKLVAVVLDEINQPEYMIDIDNIQAYYLKLSSELYLMVDKLKQFEIYSSLAKRSESESYNNAYLQESVTADKKPTVAELQIKAEAKSKKEALVNTVYASAFKTMKSKVDAASNLADSLKNILKLRANIEFAAGNLGNK